MTFNPVAEALSAIDQLRWGAGGPTVKDILNNPELRRRDLSKGDDLLYEARKIAETARRRMK